MKEILYSEIFNNDFLKALSNWQNGWYENQDERRKIADKLEEECNKLPKEFKSYNLPCYRKRFIIEGEIIKILIDDELFEGIASWTTNVQYAKTFKGFVKPSTKFAMLFKHIPTENEIIVNIPALWGNADFVIAANNFKKENESEAKALFNFKDSQSEIILRSTLKGSEIEDIVGISHSFDEICDKVGIPKEDREKLSIEYARNPEGIAIELPVFAGAKATKSALKKTIEQFITLYNHAIANNIPIFWGDTYSQNKDDLKHKPL